MPRHEVVFDFYFPKPDGSEGHAKVTFTQEPIVTTLPLFSRLCQEELAPHRGHFLLRSAVTVQGYAERELLYPEED